MALFGVVDSSSLPSSLSPSPSFFCLEMTVPKKFALVAWVLATDGAGLPFCGGGGG
jgi:hypothetical protein